MASIPFRVCACVVGRPGNRWLGAQARWLDDAALPGRPQAALIGARVPLWSLAPAPGSPIAAMVTPAPAAELPSPSAGPVSAAESQTDVLIVGGGVCGTALLFELSRYTDLGHLTLVERYDQLAQVNSKPAAIAKRSTAATSKPITRLRRPSR